MNRLNRKTWNGKRNKEAGQPEPAESQLSTGQPQRATPLEMDFEPDDPLLAYLLKASGVVEVNGLALDSPALRRLKEAGVKISAPLISQGELIGVLNLGPRRSEQDYSSDDRRMIASLAAQAAPALRLAQLARQQQIEARRRERIEQELRVAGIVQQTLLPKDLPSIPGWELAALWQPAREMSGDFYDFLLFPDGRLGLIIGDVTDKGVPAALVMATTRSILRAAAERMDPPGEALERANNLLCPDIPPKMFATCLYMILDPATGCLQYANAGHNLPHLQTQQGVVELRATGMPLGLIPGMTYEQKEFQLEPGYRLLMYTDGLVEAHNPEGEMFSTPRLQELMAREVPVQPGITGGAMLMERLRLSLAEFTGPGWEQEDDVTLVTLEYIGPGQPAENSTQIDMDVEGPDQVLAEFTLPSRLGSERLAMEAVTEAVIPLNLPVERLERLKTAVGEAVMNAMEHGNQFVEDLPVSVTVFISGQRLVVQVRDCGGQPLPEQPPIDLEAKLDGEQSMRGWGLFIIRSWVDELNSVCAEGQHTLELVWNL